MSEMNRPEEKSPQEHMQEYIEQSRQWLGDALELVGAERGASLVDVFPAATEPRDVGKAIAFVDGEEKALPAEQYESRLREIAGRFGIGGERDVPVAASHHLIEGGKVWKIEAEAAIAKDGQSLIFAGSPYRKPGQDEIDYMRVKFGEAVVADDMTEYDIARFIASLQPGFEPLEEDSVLPFGYEVAPGCRVIHERTGQLVQIGEKQGQEVVLLRVDQDSPTPPFYRPDSAALMGFVADVLTEAGDEDSAIAINTSNTYASRAIDVLRAGLRRGRKFAVGMYGRQTLMETGAPVPSETAYHQIPGELHTIAAKLAQLEEEIDI